MNSEYVLLVEKEAMWAQMLVQVLSDNNIPCSTLPVHGAAMVIKAGVQERLKVYVPSENLTKALELMQDLFPSEVAQEE